MDPVNCQFEFKELPFEIQQEILKKLPIAELPHISSVCKQWATFYKRKYFEDTRISFYEEKAKKIHASNMDTEAVVIALAAIGSTFFAAFGAFYSYRGDKVCQECDINLGIIGFAGFAAFGGSLMFKYIRATNKDMEELKNTFDEI